MDFSFRAVILDMDGILINSEPLWRIAMIKGFAQYGMHVTEDECRTTMGRRIDEVIRLWQHRKGNLDDPQKIEQTIENELLQLIRTVGEPIPGALEIIDTCERSGIPCGLATSSSVRLMTAVIEKLDLAHKLKAAESAEMLKFAKPHPEVFLRCAEKLNVQPANCLVIEDSLNGVIAGKAASMKVIAVPDDWQTKIQQFAVADFRCESMVEAHKIVIDLLKA